MKQNNNQSFSERHPKLNTFFGLIILLALVALAITFLFFLFKYIGMGIQSAVEWISSVASKLDAVIIVALITACVSIVSVIFSSVIAKRIEYRKSRQAYLAQKREEPYGEFVEMVYKIQQNSKGKDNYSQKEMIDDISKFSKQLTLWGSSRVVNKWVKFRENGANPENAKDNLFLLEKIMNDMRKDLGQHRVRKGKLLGFFVNDIKSAMKNKK